MVQSTNIWWIKEALDKNIKSEFAAAIKKNREERLASFEQILENLHQKLGESDLQPLTSLKLIEDSLDQFLAIVTQQEYETLPRIYISAVNQLSSRFEKQVIIEQNDNRFYSLKNDSVIVRSAKTIKRWRRRFQQKILSLRNWGRRLFKRQENKGKTWYQQIPIQKVIEYHLFARPELAQQWIDEDEHLLVSLIIELEEHLATGNSSIEKNQTLREPKENLKNLVTDALKKIQDQKSTLHEKLWQECLVIQKILLEHIEKAGTIEKKASFYSEVRLQSISLKTIDKLSSHLEEWKKVRTSLLKKTETVNQFLIFRQKLHEKTRAFSGSLGSYLEDHFYTNVDRIKQNILAVQAHLQDLKQKSINKEKAYITSSRQELLDQLQNLQDTFSESLNKNELQELAEFYAEEVLLLANELSESTILAEDLQLGKKPPTVDLKNIEWRLLVIRTLKDQLLDNIKSSEQQYDEFLQDLISKLREISEVIEVNLDYAVELFEKNKETDNPIDIASQALGRSQLKLEQSITTVRSKHTELETLTHEGGQIFADQMLELLHRGDSNELQLLDAKYRVMETTLNWKTKLRARWARTQDYITLLWRYLESKTKKQVHDFTTTLGFQKVVPRHEIKIDIAHYLTETDSKLSELPYIYRRLFNFQSDSDRRFYVSKQENFTYLGRALDRWEKGFPATIAVVGEKGSGKSTYLNFATNEVFANKEITRITLKSTYHTSGSIVDLLKNELDLGEAEDVESVVASLRKKKSIIVLEALQNLYLRNTRGYEALETFLYIISETKDTVFWVSSCSSYAWNFLQKALSMNEYFTHIIRTDNLVDEQIRSLIMSRHEASGFKLVFEPGESQKRNRSYRKLLDQEDAAQKYLSQAYFEELAEISQGNASVAMIFWVRSIRDFTNTHFYISPMEVASLTLVEELSSNVLFTLAALILHDTLTPNQLSMILQFNEQESRMMLTRLKTRGLLKQTGEYYSLNHLMYRQLVRVLKERNIIHLF